MRRFRLLAVALMALSTLELALGAGVGLGTASGSLAQPIEIMTVPVGRHLRFELAGHIDTTDDQGRAIVPGAEVDAVRHELRTNPLLQKLLPNRQPDGSSGSSAGTPGGAIASRRSTSTGRSVSHWPHGQVSRYRPGWWTPW